MKDQFTKEEVIKMIKELIERPDILMDAIQNEYTDWDAEELFELAVSKL